MLAAVRSLAIALSLPVKFKQLFLNSVEVFDCVVVDVPPLEIKMNISNRLSLKSSGGFFASAGKGLFIFEPVQDEHSSRVSLYNILIVRIWP